jgi:ubiquinone/menaquinone biosynthesis C-methylase UbiE
MELVNNPMFARYFARCGARLEEHGGRAARIELLAGLSGRVVEVGAGTGLNFRYYPEAVREIVAVEPEPYLRGHALRAAMTAPVPVSVVAGTASELPADDAEFDALVISGVLCSVADVPAALAEFHRVLRPGGQLRFWEHVRSRDPLFAAFQQAADLVMPLLMGGCHAHRDTQAAIGRVFTVDSCRGFRLPPGAVLFPPAPRILGTARKPGPQGS